MRPPRRRQQPQWCSSKTVIGDDGAIEIAVPRDRQGSFEPQIVAKGQTRLDVLTTGSSAFTPEECRCARSKGTCKSCTGSRSRPI